jgi:hypothetical protein
VGCALLFTLTTAQRVGVGGTALTVSLQTGASAIGSAALPAGIGLSTRARGRDRG